MNETIQITIRTNDEQVRGQVIARLSEINFDAFEEKDEELICFINVKNFDQERTERILLPYNLSYNTTTIQEQNWNKLWESNFDPVVVDDFCAVRAHFHQPFTDTRYEIIITPKMSFGTGHHATTYMMLSEMSKLNFANKKVADFGTGTGVLAILAEKIGSEFVWAIDNDSWSIENAEENIKKNSCRKVIIEKANRFNPHHKFDIILANINKNVILSNVNELCAGVNPGGKILLSGLLKEDENDIVFAFNQNRFIHKSTTEKKQWICLLFKDDTVS